MERQKFCSCPIFFDEPFTREWDSLPREIRVSYLYIREVYIYARNFTSHYFSKFQDLIATDFLQI